MGGSSKRVESEARYRPVDAPELFAGAQRAVDSQLERTVLLWTPPRVVSGSRIDQFLAAPPHPNLAVARSDVVVGGRRTVVLDDLDGVPLADRLAAGELTSHEAQRWIDEIRAAVDHLHVAGIVHGAVCAENVVLVDDGNARRAVLVGLGARSSTWRDARQVRRLSAALGLRTRRTYPRVGFATSALIVAMVVTAIVRDESSAAGRTPKALPVVAEPSSERVAQPITAALPEVAAPVAARPAAGAVRVVPEILNLLGPRARRALPERVAVYRTTTTSFGQFDVFEGHTTGVPVLQYRTTFLSAFWRNIVSLGDGWLLFYRDFDGYMTTAPVEANGQLGYGDATIKDDPGWSHVAHAGNGLAWFYDSDTGAARVIRYVDGFHTVDRRIADAGVGGGAVAVVGLGGGRVLHYFGRDGRGVVVTLDTTGAVIGRQSVRLPRSLTAIAATDDGLLLGVASLVDAKLIRIGDGGVTVVRSVDLGSELWTSAVGLGQGVLVTSLTGATRIVMLPPGEAPRITKWQIPLTATAAVVK